ncbi:hypothetical protein D1007_18282 [Hordeum vulgare]|nr:hypothetical protein D1007_18282 [Hordeum vulgare]
MVEMGYILGDKLGKVLTVAHRNKKIFDEYLRVRVEHLVDEPLRKAIDRTPVGGTIEISSNVKYEKLPNFCLACGLLGHTSARFCSIPKEIRKHAFSTDNKALTFWSTMETSSGPGCCHFGLVGRQGDRDIHDIEKSELIKLPKKVLDVQATTGKQHKIMDAAVVHRGAMLVAEVPVTCKDAVVLVHKDANQRKLEMFAAADGAMHVVAKEVGQGVLPLGAAKVVPVEGGSVGGAGDLVKIVPQMDTDESGAESKWGR